MPERKTVIEREDIESTGHLYYTTPEKHRNAIEVPQRKECYLEPRRSWYDDWPDHVSDSMRNRHWILMTTRVASAKDTFYHLVEVNPLVRGGVAVIKPTRVPVSSLLANLATDMRLSEIADDLNLSAETLSAILRCLATVFDRPANEHDSTGRVHQLKALNKSVSAGG